MKQSIFVFTILFLIFTTCGISQTKDKEAQALEKSGGTLPMGLGATFIDNEMYYLINIAPEVAFGDLGVGLDLNLRFNTKGKIRPGDYETFNDYLRIIRYVRWAQKGDPFYIRVGQLDYSLLGHGSIIYNYRNSASYDLRKIGIELDLNFNSYGFESMYSDVSGKGLLGLRGYVKPLKFTSLAKIPVINNFEVGATYARDLVDSSDYTTVYSTTYPLGALQKRGGLTIVGFDLGLPIISYPMIKSSLYFDYAKIVNYGSGVTTGINMFFSGLGLVQLKGKYELRFNGKNYLPSYFNALYERDRFNPATQRSKSDTLKNVGDSKGYYGEIVISILGTLNIIGGYQAPFDSKNQGIMHAELQLPEIAGIVIRGSYDKARVGRMFILDENTILSGEIGYKPMKYLMISTLYQRTFTDRDKNGNKLGYYKAQDRVEPKVSFIFDF